MTTPLDLDRLQRIHDAMTPGPWREWSQPEPIRCFWRDGLPPGSGSIESTTSMSAFGEAVAATPNLHSQDLLGIIALRNAFPALLAELRKLRAYRERRVAELVVERDAARADAARLREALECVAKMECTEHGDDQDGACQSCAALSAARRALKGDDQ